jgi:hypothetical protein
MAGLVCGEVGMPMRENCETKPIFHGDSTLRAAKRSQFEAVSSGSVRETNPLA